MESTNLAVPQLAGQLGGTLGVIIHVSRIEYDALGVALLLFVATCGAGTLTCLVFARSLDPWGMVFGAAALFYVGAAFMPVDAAPEYWPAAAMVYAVPVVVISAAVSSFKISRRIKNRHA